MANIDRSHAQTADDLVIKVANDYGYETFPGLRNALLAQAHATLGLIEAVEKLTKRIP